MTRINFRSRAAGAARRTARLRRQWPAFYRDLVQGWGVHVRVITVCQPVASCNLSISDGTRASLACRVKLSTHWEDACQLKPAEPVK